MFGTSNWVLAKRSERVLRQYGTDVYCLTSAEYEFGQRMAVMVRAKSMNVAVKMDSKHRLAI